MRRLTTVYAVILLSWGCTGEFVSTENTDEGPGDGETSQLPPPSNTPSNNTAVNPPPTQPPVQPPPMTGNNDTTMPPMETTPVDPPPPPAPMFFEEINGLVAIEAEHFISNDDRDRNRAWYLTSTTETPGLMPDPDPNHAESASGEAYLETLPDTRVTHADPLTDALYNDGGAGPTLTYRVFFNTTGRYYVHARAYSTGGEDNGLHVGIDGDWPESGNKIQWCAGKNRWTWSSKRRDTGGEVCGVDDAAFIEVEAPGEHQVVFSMREDGMEFDKFVLTTEAGYQPEDAGPPERLKQ